MKKRILSGILALALFVSVFCVGVSAIASTDFELKASGGVTVDGTADKTVNIVFSPKNNAVTVVTLQGTFEADAAAKPYFTCTGSDCPYTLAGTNIFDTASGKYMYSDSSFVGYNVEKGANIVTAVYTVDKDTPTGDYTICIKDALLEEGVNGESFQSATYEATVHVTNTYKPTVDVESVTLSESKLDMFVGDSETLTATVLPAEATEKDVTWTSSDPKVATVDENGKVTAVKAGTATITVKSVSNNTVTDTCEVTVTDQPVSVTGVTLNPDKATLNVGETQKLTVEFAPTNATNKHVTWVSSNEAVATVADGIVTAVGKGTATITVTTEDGNHTATCEITVKIPVSGVTLNPTSTALVVGDTKQLTATVEPANADDSTVIWRSGDTNVATVDQNGNVTAVGVGSTTITATAGGKNATCKITVTAKPVPIQGIALADAEIFVGYTVQFAPVFSPADTTERDVKWSSSDTKIATVDANGRVTGVAEGKVTITVTSTANPAITASCTVTVTKNLSDAGLAAIIGALGNGSLPFNDVTVRDYFYDAVKWAVDREITSGTSRYTFSPDAPCTRAQVVTFLWRAAGCPQPVSKVNPFTDVRADDYFYEAVLWAVENGITNGTSAKTFSPDATVTRAQVVTFLWRANGQPAAGNSGFADVSADKYYATAVAWAVFQRITTGTGFSVFSPDAACTRAQIVTFLYRAN
jgi:uncharacterized protein YjdB